MAGSRKSPPSSALLAQVSAVLEQHVRRGDRLVAALSGGVDSVVLLDLLRRLSRKLRFELAALHVNHQLHPAAGRWAAFCRAFCRQHGVSLTVVRVTVPRSASLEAAARVARYRAFAALPADFVVLAHNLDDQAETVLLQLLRGAGVRGLSAMPEVRSQESGLRAEDNSKSEAKRHPSPQSSVLSPAILRPLLDLPRSEIEAYARRRKLKWIEDDSNADIGFDRNFLRHRVLPVIAQRYPAYRKTLSRASRNFADAALLLDDLALADGERHVKDGALELSGLRRLSQARAKNLLRYFLASRGVEMPSAERLGEALRQGLTAKQDAHVLIELGDASLRRFDGRLYVTPASAPPRHGFAKRWRGERKIALPELNGVLTMTECRGNGISLAKLQSKVVTIRLRRGGERLQPDRGRPRRTLKKLLQESRIAPWRRERTPLIFCDGELVWAAGVGMDCAYRAARNEPALCPGWHPFE